MRSLKDRLRNYKIIQAKINIIDLDIELKDTKHQNCRELLKVKRALLEEEAYIDSLLEKLTEQELFTISLLYNTNMTIIDLSELLMPVEFLDSYYSFLIRIHFTKNDYNAILPLFEKIKNPTDDDVYFSSYAMIQLKQNQNANEFS